MSESTGTLHHLYRKLNLNLLEPRLGSRHDRLDGMFTLLSYDLSLSLGVFLYFSSLFPLMCPLNIFVFTHKRTLKRLNSVDVFHYEYFDNYLNIVYFYINPLLSYYLIPPFTHYYPIFFSLFCLFILI